MTDIEYVPVGMELATLIVKVRVWFTPSPIPVRLVGRGAERVSPAGPMMLVTKVTVQRSVEEGGDWQSLPNPFLGERDAEAV